MLKRFTVENFSSFYNEQSFDLTAGRTEVHPEHIVDFKDVKLLKSSVIYGANASGKSNLVKSIDYAKKIIINGLNKIDTFKKYFRLDPSSSNKPSSFEFELEFNNKFYSFGFSSILKDKLITEEWLYEIGKQKSKMIFQRSSEGIELGKTLQEKELKSRFEIYRDDMKNQNSQLFLSEIANKDLEIEEVQIINQIYNWFDEQLLIIYPNDRFKGISSIDSNLAKTFTKYLSEFDTGVVNIESIEEDFEISLKDFPEELKNEIENDLSKKDVKQVIINKMGLNGSFLTIYKDDNNELKVKKLGLVHGQKFQDVFELKDESDGTRRLLDFIPLISKFTENYTIIIDEFDRSLHPKLSKAFFELFYRLNDSNTQLIVTTHESTLLDLDLVRRDEIWFVEKNESDSSQLFSLNKFKIRYDSKIEKAYLLGRYGAVPIFKTFDSINWEE